VTLHRKTAENKKQKQYVNVYRTSSMKFSEVYNDENTILSNQ